MCSGNCSGVEKDCICKVEQEKQIDSIANTNIHKGLLDKVNAVAIQVIHNKRICEIIKDSKNLKFEENTEKIPENNLHINTHNLSMKKYQSRKIRRASE